MDVEAFRIAVTNSQVLVAGDKEKLCEIAEELSSQKRQEIVQVLEDMGNRLREVLPRYPGVSEK